MHLDKIGDTVINDVAFADFKQDKPEVNSTHVDMLWKQTTINCRGILLDLQKPVVMAVINATPDSFYDGGRYHDNLTSKVRSFVQEGAAIIDIGGMSSRPGAKIISASEESDRILPVLELVQQEAPDIPISIDTIHAEVARQALEAGAHIVNDISAGSMDPGILDIAAKYRAPYILMHMQGNPSNMQESPTYDDSLIEVLDFLIWKTAEIMNRGIIDIIIDPGFGFGKSVDDNYSLLSNLHVFKIIERPILVGLSRKSMIQKVLQLEAAEALNGTSALHMIALNQGAQILRVHDVSPAVECITLWLEINKRRRSG